MWLLRATQLYFQMKETIFLFFFYTHTHTHTHTHILICMYVRIHTRKASQLSFFLIFSLYKRFIFTTNIATKLSALKSYCIMLKNKHLWQSTMLTPLAIHNVGNPQCGHPSQSTMYILLAINNVDTLSNLQYRHPCRFCNRLIWMWFLK